MKSKFTYSMVVILALTISMNVIAQNKEYQVVSPDKNIIVTTRLNNKGQLQYHIRYGDNTILQWSALGFEFFNMPALKTGLTVADVKKYSKDTIWEQVWGEQHWVKENFNQLLLTLKEKKGSRRTFRLNFKVFNDGVGFRYEIPSQNGIDSIIIKEELTEFNFPDHHNAWWIPVHRYNSYYESLYQLTPMNVIDTANTPITIETKNGYYLAIHEANLTDYASMTLLKRDSTHFISCLVPWSDGVKVYTKAPMQTPWRILIIGQKPGDLVTSTLMINLNEPCAISDVSWIKPSKYIGIWWAMHLDKYTWGQGTKHGATTENTMRYMDFAAQHGFSGVLVEGWNYGWDGKWYEDGTAFNFTTAYPDFDIEKVTDYGKNLGVKLIGHHETGGAVINYERQMEDAFKLYQRLGVDAVKTGYVNKYLDGKEWHDSQYGVRHYLKVIETAAKYRIMIDNHEPVKPTGLCRTYPNFMTQEGARGQEYDAWSSDGGNPPSHTTILPFTRMLAGPLDFTPGTFNFITNPRNGARVQTTLAKQLALYVVLYSPMQMASDLPENYCNNQAFDFIKAVPVDWEETHVIDAKIGDYVITVRKDRNSDDWYLGAITDENSREFIIELNFLINGRTYLAQIYKDSDDADWKNNPAAFSYQEIEVTANQNLLVKLAPGGGQAIRFRPVK